VGVEDGFAVCRGRLSSVWSDKGFLVRDIERLCGSCSVGDSTGFEASTLGELISRPRDRGWSPPFFSASVATPGTAPFALGDCIERGSWRRSSDGVGAEPIGTIFPFVPARVESAGWDTFFHLSGSLSESFFALGCWIANWCCRDFIEAVELRKEPRTALSQPGEGDLTQDPPKP
jgi:hypothetical protein